MNFNKSIYENIKTNKSPFIASHRGVCGANIPCNTLASFKIALDEGADVVEIDVSKSKDGQYFVFHPGTEKIFLGMDISLKNLNASEIKHLRLINQDNTITSYSIPTLNEVLTFLKDKTYINVDKFWTDIEGITKEIRKAGVEKQVIVKTFTDENSLNEVEKFAPDLMFMPLVREQDEITDKLLKRNINFIGTEVLFSKDNSPVISNKYIESMHQKHLLIWTNSIIYNEKDVISAHHTDDISLTKSPEDGWGWLIDKKVDFIQTDWVTILKRYIDIRKNN